MRTLYLDGATARTVGGVCGADADALTGAISLLCVMGGPNGVNQMRDVAAKAVDDGIAAPLVASTSAAVADLVQVLATVTRNPTLTLTLTLTRTLHSTIIGAGWVAEHCHARQLHMRYREAPCHQSGPAR